MNALFFPLLVVGLLSGCINNGVLPSSGGKPHKEAAESITVVRNGYEGYLVLRDSKKVVRIFPQGSQNLTFDIEAELDYNLDNGCAIGGSGFAFKLDATGNLICRNPAAADVVDHELRLRTAKINVEPGAYGSNGGICQIQSCAAFNTPGAIPTNKITQSRAFPLICGLVSRLDLCKAGVEFRPPNKYYASLVDFLVRRDGTVYPIPPTLGSPYPASGGDHLLKLNSAVVTITPPSPTTKYSVGFGSGTIAFTGTATNVPVVLGCYTEVRDAASGDLQYFIPYYGADSARLIIGGKYYSWAFSNDISNQ